MTSRWSNIRKRSIFWSHSRKCIVQAEMSIRVFERFKKAYERIDHNFSKYDTIGCLSAYTDDYSSQLMTTQTGISSQCSLLALYFHPRVKETSSKLYIILSSNKYSGNAQKHLCSIDLHYARSNNFIRVLTLWSERTSKTKTSYQLRGWFQLESVAVFLSFLSFTFVWLEKLREQHSAVI